MATKLRICIAWMGQRGGVSEGVKKRGSGGRHMSHWRAFFFLSYYCEQAAVGSCSCSCWA